MTPYGAASTLAGMTGPAPRGVIEGAEPSVVEPSVASPSRVTGGKVVLLALSSVLGGVLLLGALVTLAVFGTRRYLHEARAGEGRETVPKLGSGIIRCAMGSEGGAGARRGLPESSRSVPPTLAEVQGREYESRASDWSDPTFTCAGFSLSEPQRFLYRWERRSETHGAALAIADLDGDGAADLTLAQEVRCDGDGSCTGGPLVESTSLPQ